LPQDLNTCTAKTSSSFAAIAIPHRRADLALLPFSTLFGGSFLRDPTILSFRSLPLPGKVVFTLNHDDPIRSAFPV